jgi:hypothetical protein
MVADAVFYAIDSFIRHDWRAHGFAGIDARDLVVGGWRNVAWSDSCVREYLWEGIEDYIAYCQDEEEEDKSDDDAPDADQLEY